MFVTSFDALRYLTGPFGRQFCHLQFILKTAVKTMIILHYDLIFISRYILILWVKNPIAIKDRFWAHFLGLWVSLAAIVTDFTRYSLPGKEAFAFYICTGTDSTADKHLPNKPTSFIELSSILLIVAISVRISIYRRKHFGSRQQIHPNVVHKLNDLSHIEDSTIADVKSLLVFMATFSLYLIVLIRLRDLSPKETNVYPNYLFIYFHQMIFPQLFAFLAAILYYFRHPPLKKAMKRETKEFLQNLMSRLTN